MWVVMSAAEREQFLAGVHVGVLSAAVGTAGLCPHGPPEHPGCPSGQAKPASQPGQGRRHRQ